MSMPFLASPMVDLHDATVQSNMILVFWNYFPLNEVDQVTRVVSTDIS